MRSSRRRRCSSRKGERKKGGTKEEKELINNTSKFSLRKEKKFIVQFNRIIQLRLHNFRKNDKLNVHFRKI